MFPRRPSFPGRHGRSPLRLLAAAVLALMVVVAGGWAAVGTGQWLWAVAGAAAAAVGYCLALSYVELVKVIVDMLLPKP